MMAGIVAGRRPSAPAFAPSDLASLVAWYDAQTITDADGTIQSGWEDRFASFDATLSSGTGPTIQHNEIGGKKALLFVATDAGRLTMSTSLLGSVSEASYFAVLRRTNDPAASGADAGAVLDGFSLDAGASRASHLPYSDGNIYEHFCTSARKTVGNPTPSLTSARIYSVHSAANDFRAYLDATQIYTTGSNTVQGGSGSTKRIGHSNGNGGFSYFNGLIAEICIFNAALSTGDRQKMEGYLAHKYGLTANLPGGHPYISSPPSP